MGRKTPLYGKIPDFRRQLAETTGSAFAVGAALSAAFHFQKGFLSRSPSFGGGRAAAGALAARANALRFAGTLAAFNALFFASERAVALARRSEDRWNNVAAGAEACGIRQLRHGPRDAVVTALAGAFLMALVHGADLSLDRMVAAAAAAEEERSLEVEGDLGPAASADHSP